MADRFAAVGRVRRAHGLRGELVVEAMTDEPGAFLAPGCRVFVGDAEGAPLRTPDGAPRLTHVTACRPFQDAWLLRVDGCDDRTEGDRWRDRHLLVPMDELPEPAEGEAYLHELVGVPVVDPAGAAIGAVVGWYELPQGLILEVETARGVRDVPFVEAFVRVDRPGRRVVLDAPDGLLD